MKAIHIKKPAEIQRMRAAGIVVARVLDAVAEVIAPGVTTGELDELAEQVIDEAGGRASFLKYQVGDRIYPAHICASINEEVVHGIPGPRPLRRGEIVSIDVGVFLDGFHADSAATFPVGPVSAEARRLLEATEAALWAGIEAVRAGRRVGSISLAVQRAAESRGYYLAKNLVGHGVGRNLHEDPAVPNEGKLNSGPQLQAGMTLAIEPMLNVGCAEVVGLDDGWTIITADGSLSAHFEHTVAVTRTGVEVLTLPPAGRANRSLSLPARAAI
jgi:methionyl aminopeptidase